MGKSESKHHRAKKRAEQRSCTTNTLNREYVDSTVESLKILEDKIRRREELVTAAESKYLPLQRGNVQNLKPGTSEEASGIDRPASYNIGFFGMPAVGKSSLLNSIFFAVRGSLPSTQKVQVVPIGYKGKYPTSTQQLRVTDHICMIAYRGTELQDILINKEVVLQRVRSQLAGGPERNASARSDESGDSSNIQRRSTKETHCAVVVIRPSRLEHTKEQYRLLIDEIKTFTGSYPVGLITNFEESEQTKVETTRGFLATNGIDDIYEVMNTHVEPLPKKDQIALLDMIERCMCLSDRMYSMREED